MNYLSDLKILVVGKYLNKLDSYDYINIVETLIDLGHLVKIFDTNSEYFSSLKGKLNASDTNFSAFCLSI